MSFGLILPDFLVIFISALLSTALDFCMSFGIVFFIFGTGDLVLFWGVLFWVSGVLLDL